MRRQSRLYAASCRFALVAVLLLALLPGIGRILTAATGTTAPTQAMCTVTGLREVAVPGAHWRGLQRAPAPARPAPPGDGDCAYCPLLASTVASAVPSALFAPVDLPPPVIAFAPRFAESTLDPGGPGSRGPPAGS